MKFKCLFIIFFLFFVSCAKEVINTEDNNLKYNFSLVAFNSEIDNPKKDRLSFYVVYVDKIEAGRTTTGLESQEKYFEVSLTNNKHLITVEKWVLDESKGRYVKLNNIDQPKPNYIYISIEKDKITRVVIKTGNSGVAIYTSETK